MFLISQEAMTYKIKKMINNGTEYKIGSIDSSNNTYNNIVHLSQADYDSLENPDSDTLYSTPDGEAEGFIEDTPFGSSWDGVTDKAPSMNAVYDVLGDVETLLANI